MSQVETEHGQQVWRTRQRPAGRCFRSRRVREPCRCVVRPGRETTPRRLGWRSRSTLPQHGCSCSPRKAARRARCQTQHYASLWKRASADRERIGDVCEHFGVLDKIALNLSVIPQARLQFSRTAETASTCVYSYYLAPAPVLLRLSRVHSFRRYQMSSRLRAAGPALHSRRFALTKNG